MAKVRMVWTPELLDQLPSFRGDGPKLPLLSPNGKELFADAATAGYRGISEGAKKIIKTGALGSITDEAAAGPLAFFVETKKTKLTDEARGAIARALVDRWVAAFGTAGVMDLFPKLVMPPKLHHWELKKFFAPAALRLRQHLAWADDYDAALKKATQLLAAFPMGKDTRRSPPFSTTPLPELLSFLFPDHRPFFDAAVEHNTKLDWIFTFLVGSFSKPKDLETHWPKANGNEWALAISRKLGAKGLGPLADYRFVSVGLARALSVYVDERAAKALVRHLEKQECRTIVKRYFERYPELSEALDDLPANANASLRNAAQRLRQTVGSI